MDTNKFTTKHEVWLLTRGLLEFEAPRISGQSAQEDGTAVSATHPSGKIPGTHFC